MALTLGDNLTGTLASGNKHLADSTGDIAIHDNYTGSFDEQIQYPIIESIEQYSIPLLCLLGLTGNTLATIVFLQKPLRNSSCSIFLATRGLSDNGFLSTLFVIWISRTFKLYLGAVSGICRIVIFLSYVCGCISVWLVVFVTIENYIRICKPFIVNRVCKTTTAKIAVLLLCVIATGIYNFPFWAMSGDTCQPFPEHINLVEALVYADAIITLVIPLVCITVPMTAIVCDLIKSYNRRSRLRAPTLKRVNNPMAKVTKMLLAVTVSFFILNLPSHVNRLRLMISSFVNESDPPTSMDQAIQQTTLVISYLSLTINVFVYVLFGSKFRKVFKETFCCFSCKLRGITQHASGRNDSGRTVEVKIADESEMSPLNPRSV